LLLFLSIMLRLALGALLLVTGASADLLPLPGFAAALIGNRQDIKVCPEALSGSALHLTDAL